MKVLGWPLMSEQYRLVFSGEVLGGQHAAVVKKRLTALLKLDDARMDVLFSGKAVVVKKATDEKTAARYQEAFSKAGARLRVLPVEGAAAAEDPLQAAEPQPAPAQPEAADESGLAVLPVGADLLTDAERPAPVDAQVATDHLSLAQPNEGRADSSAAAAPAAEVPSVDHLTLAELGARLGTEQAREVVVAEIHADFDLAEVGAVLGALEAAEPPPAPDTSHLSLDPD